MAGTAFTSFWIAAAFMSKKVWMAFLAAAATSGLESLINISTSSSKQAPRSPIWAKASTAATRVLASPFMVKRQTSAAYICPSSPQPVTAFTAATRTFQDLSLKSLQRGSKNASASSPMWERLSTALALTAGFESSRSSATAAALDELGEPVVAICPKTLHAAAETLGAGSFSKSVNCDSNRDVSDPSCIWLRAVTAAVRISQSLEFNNSMSLGIEEALPNTPSAPAAAHAGLRNAADAFGMTPAAVNM
mmetsp:Transcript_42111/g.78262  ORF Transcript_42111/g.78262 Transcript_42111/m.78262 type:complete len:249 (+) Transcript_42111:1067-1813(+)